METRTKVLALVAAVLMGGMLIAAARLPNLNPTYMAGHDGASPQIVLVDSAGTLATGGPVADNGVATGNPVAAGCDVQTTRPTYANLDRGTIQCDTRGNAGVTLYYAGTGTAMAGLTPADATTNAAFNLGVSNYGQMFNGATWDREFTCPSTAVVNVAAAATTQLVALSASTVIRVCSMVLTADTAATTATFVYGTGANCATGQTAITGAMRFVDEGNITLSSANGSIFRGLAANAICLTAATGAVTGFITYAQY